MGPQGPPAPVASLRAKGAPLRGREVPVDYLDNPERRRETQPSVRPNISKKLRILAGIHTRISID